MQTYGKTMNWNKQCNWQPNASLEALRFRAEIIAKIRDFFAQRNVLEVETPLLGYSTATDPYLTSFVTQFCDSNSSQSLFLQTSPEFPMKRLLAAGSGAIFQICKAFRNGEVSKRHNPEFTILEWYRPGFDHHSLMDEMDDLLIAILQCEHADRMSYQQLFEQYVNINPHHCDESQLLDSLKQNNIEISDTTKQLDKDGLLDLLLSHLIEPNLGLEKPIFIYDYPVSQAALARIREDEFPVGERFEVYFKGLELANGYHELSDPKEQYQRFLADNATRSSLSLQNIPIDDKFLSALETFPQCAGVALGVDRLIMLAMQTIFIQDVISFAFERVRLKES